MTYRCCTWFTVRTDSGSRLTVPQRIVGHTERGGRIVGIAINRVYSTRKTSRWRLPQRKSLLSQHEQEMQAFTSAAVCFCGETESRRISMMHNGFPSHDRQGVAQPACHETECLMAGNESRAERMRTSGWPLMIVLVGGCQPPASPVSSPDLVEPAVFSTWASATEKPVQVGPDSWADCRAPTPVEAKALDAGSKLHGPIRMNLS